MNVEQIVSWRLCLGCGACLSVCPEKKIRMVDFEDTGIRPVVRKGNCDQCSECVKACPGWDAGIHPEELRGGVISELRPGFGPVLEIWEGFAGDPEIRLSGSSGGASTAISLYCLEKEGMGGVIHTGPSGESPWKNRSAISLSREDLLPRTGSRYAPASICDALGLAESVVAPCVFIGKPCDVEGLRKVQAMKPGLGDKIGLAIGIFCAGTPSTRGTLELLRSMKLDARSVEEIRYRGNGWPGNFSARLKGEKEVRMEMSYRDSWGFLQKYRPFRCYLCPDGTAEFADISCGDPWYREIKEDEAGYSLVLVRTDRGKRILEGAMKAGYVQLQLANSDILERSQKNLLGKRGEIWGRLLALKMFGIPTPKYSGFPLYENWKKLPIDRKARSIVGTFRRLIKRKYYNPIPEIVKYQNSCR